MTVATTAREAKRKDGQLIAYPMSNVKIPKGALVNINCDGYADNALGFPGEAFAGVAYETVDNSAGSMGDLSIRVETTGTFIFAVGDGNGAQTDVGKEFYVVDNQTVTNDRTDNLAGVNNGVAVGIAVESIDADTVRIRIDRYAS